LLTPDVIRELCDAFDGAEGRMVACEYAGTFGVPALFERSRFGELLQLKGDRGAKRVLARHPEDVLRVPWPDGAVDIDRPGDYV
jgi:molybdenum cofactor cytidylyltransferase